MSTMLDNDTPENRAAMEKLVQDTQARIMEHAEVVVTLVSGVAPDGGTWAYSAGRGNWHARRGLMERYLARCDEEDREEKRREMRGDE